MGTFLEDKDRNVVPRLRSFETTSALRELTPVSITQVTNEVGEKSDSLLSKIKAWKENKTISFAGDLVSAAFVLEQTEEAVEAAQFLLARHSGASDAARLIARKTLELREGDENKDITITDVTLPHVQEIYDKIHKTRLRLHDEPRNAVLWVELSRQYALLGVDEKAIHAMDTAVLLGPTNRFILRSASRLYIHVGKVGKAHYILERAESTKYDPWLLSAEIAAGTAANRTSRFVSAGQRMLVDESISPFQKNELASAIGTLELSHGKTKTARKLFRQALIDPTENSVAQAEWAIRKHQMEPIGVDWERLQVSTPLSFEAGAWGCFTVGDWRRALRFSLNWLRDQPFSKRPALFGSYIAVSLLEDYRSSERIIEVGLRANPDEPILLNNLAFGYASAGNIDKAEQVFSRIEFSEVKEESEIVAITATQGLLLFRRGYQKEGRAFYRRAIEEARKRGLKASSAIASIYLAREEILSASDEIEKAVGSATEESKNISDPDIQTILGKVLEMKRPQHSFQTKPLS